MTVLKTLLLFEPYYKSVIWGGDKIAALKRIDYPLGNIGESWEISDLPGYESVVASGKFKGKTITQLMKLYGKELVGSYAYEKWGDTFPLLIKLIDAKKDLSVQVHPDDDLASRLHNSRGKTEMWYIIDAKPGSMIYSGLNRPMTDEEFHRKSSDWSIMESLAGFQVQRGEFYFIPAGTVHAIGSGVTVAEIQETSDISYRIFDYDRKDYNGEKRPLHLEAAGKAVNLNSMAEGPLAKPIESTDNVVNCKFFRVDFIKPASDHEIERRKSFPASFSVIMAVHGDILCWVEGCEYRIPVGSTALIPACVDKFDIKASEPYLLISIPPES